jgi:hypothetical protein
MQPLISVNDQRSASSEQRAAGGESAEITKNTTQLFAILTFLSGK